MLISFEVENYGPFRDRTTLALPAPKATDAPIITTPLAQRVPSVAMIFGPNASGKTSLLDALVALSIAVEQSHRGWDPAGGTNARPFLLQPDVQGTASTWRITFLADDAAGEPGQYEYTVSMDTDAVLEEGLRFKPAATRRFRTLFQRRGSWSRLGRRGWRTSRRRCARTRSCCRWQRRRISPSSCPPTNGSPEGVLRARGLGTTEAHRYALNELIRSEHLPLVRELVAKADLGITDVRERP